MLPSGEHFVLISLLKPWYMDFSTKHDDNCQVTRSELQHCNFHTRTSPTCNKPSSHENYQAFVQTKKLAAGPRPKPSRHRLYIYIKPRLRKPQIICIDGLLLKPQVTIWNITLQRQKRLGRPYVAGVALWHAPGLYCPNYAASIKQTPAIPHPQQKNSSTSNLLQIN